MSGSQVKKCGLFYKLILPSILQQKKLRIPKNFVKNFGDELSGFATLTVPDDRLWLVTLREIDHKLWFCNGWHEFVEHYSICFGHFLVFQYEGNSNFSVYMYVLQPYKIKDLHTATKTVKDEQHNVLDEMEDDDCVEILGYTPICFASDPLKRNIFDEYVEQNTTYKSYNPPSPQNFFNRDKLKDCMNGLDEVSQNPSGGSVKSTLPLQSTQGRGVKRNELQDSEDDVRVQFLDKVTQKIEKTMQKKQRIDELHPSGAADIAQRSTRSSQHVGVQLNSMDHKNSADDVTQKFSYKAAAEHLRKVEGKNKKIDPSEQQRATPDKIEAETFRVSKTAGVRKRSLTTEERKRAINAANAFKPVNPFCRVVLRPSYLFKGCTIYLPSCFAKKHLNEVSGKIKLQFSDGKQWPVRCAYREGTTRLSQGWYEFSAENRFEEGDVCVFELLNSKDIVLKVTVFRTVEDSGCMNRH